MWNSKPYKILNDIFKFEENQHSHICFQELQHKNNWELIQTLNNTENMYIQAQVLQVFLNREGLYHRLDDKTVEERLDGLLRKAGYLQKW